LTQHPDLRPRRIEVDLALRGRDRRVLRDPNLAFLAGLRNEERGKEDDADDGRPDPAQTGDALGSR
jgi:hypothetical protein